MTDKTPYLALDPGVVKTAGLDSWLDTDAVWPVSDETQRSLYDQIQAAYLESLLEVNLADRTIMIAGYKSTQEIFSFLAGLLAVQEGRTLGLDLRTTPGSYYAKLVTAVDAGSSPSGVLKPAAWPLVPEFYERLRGNVKISPTRPKPGSTVYVDSLTTTDSAELVSKRYPTASPIYPFSISGRRETIDAPELESGYPAFFRTVEQIVDRFGIRLPEWGLGYLRDVLVGFCSAARARAEASLGYLRKLRELTIVVPRPAGANVRSVVCAARLAGHTTVGVTHGDVLGLRRSYLHLMGELLSANVYAVPTSGAKRLWDGLHDAYGIPASHRTQVESIGSNRFVEECGRAGASASTIRRLMFLEYPLTEARQANRYGLWPYQLDLLLRLARHAQSLNITTVLKRHPDRLRESDALYESSFDEILEAPFETVHESADAFLFTNISTSTLYTALTSRKPIILFDYQLEDLWPEVQSAVRERCSVIPTQIRDDQRIGFDEDAFAEAVLHGKPCGADNPLMPYLTPSSQ